MLCGAGGGINYAVGQVVFDGDNVNQTWTVPADVYSISVVCVGRGEPNPGSTSGDGGALAWASNIPVTPGATLTYTTRAAADKSNPPSGDSILSGPASGSQAAWSVTGTSSVSGSQSSTYFTGTPGASRQGNRGGNSQTGTTGWMNSMYIAGGGGAGGYSGQGGDAGDTSTNTAYNNNAAGGGGACGHGSTRTWQARRGIGGGGGGVGLLGEGSSGDWTDSQWTGHDDGWGGPPGSGGTVGDTAVYCSDGTWNCNAFAQGHGGAYGGGAGGSHGGYAGYADQEGAGGGIRIIWPGHLRLYPSTRTADE